MLACKSENWMRIVNYNACTTLNTVISWKTFNTIHEKNAITALLHGSILIKQKP